MQFIDTHLHLQDYKTGFATDIVKEALIGGVDRLVCAATGMFDWDKVARFAKQYPGTVVPAFGLHPWYLQEAKPDWLPRLREYLARFPEALIGECGLDGIKNPDDEPQNSVFCQTYTVGGGAETPAYNPCRQGAGVAGKLLGYAAGKICFSFV